MTKPRREPYSLTYHGGMTVTSTPRCHGLGTQVGHGDKVTKGIKRQLRRVLRQNPAEFERQASLAGVRRSDVERKPRSA